MTPIHSSEHHRSQSLTCAINALISDLKIQCEHRKIRLNYLSGFDSQWSFWLCFSPGSSSFFTHNLKLDEAGLEKIWTVQSGTKIFAVGMGRLWLMISMIFFQNATVITYNSTGQALTWWNSVTMSFMLYAGGGESTFIDKDKNFLPSWYLVSCIYDMWFKFKSLEWVHFWRTPGNGPKWQNGCFEPKWQTPRIFWGNAFDAFFVGLLILDMPTKFHIAKRSWQIKLHLKNENTRVNMVSDWREMLENIKE